MSTRAAPFQRSQPTDEQAAAISSRWPRSVITASAGCGKTRVLTDCYIHAIEEFGPDTLPGLVALTFTRRAARELRDRVRSEFQQRQLQSGDPQARLVAQRIDAAPISTFHAFCASLLRRFPADAGIDPGFQEVEQSIADTIKEQAISICYEHWLTTQNEDFFRLAVPYEASNLAAHLLNALNNRSRRASEDPATSRADANSIAARWQEIWNQKILPTIAQQLAEATRPHLDTVRNTPCTLPGFLKNRPTLVNFLNSDPLPALELESLVALRQATMLTGLRASHCTDDTEREALKTALSSIRAAIDQARENLDVSPAITAEMAERSAAFRRLLSTLEQEYARLKRSRNVLDFDDLQLLALQLIRTATSNAFRAWRARLRLILVDEVQDTDTIQFEVLKALCPEGAESPRLVVVGDAKQSIYSFRDARPELFHALRESVPAPARFPLTQNFRSCEQLTDFFNALFLGAFPHESDLLRSQRGPAPTGVNAGATLLKPIATANAASAEEGRRAEAAAIASHLIEQLRAGVQVWSPDLRAWRPAAPGDIALLFRAAGDIDLYRHALLDAGLEAHVVGGHTFFKQPEIIDLANLLTCVEDPVDEIALAGALRAPCVGVSDDGLFWLAHNRAGGLVDGLDNRDSIHDISSTDRQRLDRFATLLTSWRDTKDQASIAELVERVLSESGLELAALLHRHGEQAYANLRKLANRARQFDETPGMTLAHFVARLKADTANPPNEQQAPVADERGDAVRLMTIHQAKGLEFPIVVLPDLDRPPNNERDKFEYHADLGFVPRIADDIDREEIHIAAGNPADTKAESGQADAGADVLSRANAEAESLRLFYVATTRARDHLILSMRGPEPAKTPPAALRLLSEHFNLHTGACLVKLPEGCPEPALNIQTYDPLDLAESDRTSEPQPKRPQRGKAPAPTSNDPTYNTAHIKLIANALAPARPKRRPKA